MTGSYAKLQRLHSVRGASGLFFTRLAVVTTGALGVILACALSATRRYDLGLMAALVALAVAILAAEWSRLREGAETYMATILTVWFVTTPLASFYLRYPIDRSLLTYDRVTMLVVGLFLVFEYWRSHVATAESYSEILDTRRAKKYRTNLQMTRFELWWLLLAAFILLNAIAWSHNLGAALKTAIDAFAIPIIAFHAARNFFDPKTHGKALLIGAIVLAFFLATVGAYELITGQNAFAYKGSGLFREGEPRVNGPFASDSSYSVISLLIFIFLLAAPRLFSIKFDKGARLIYLLSIAAAATAALLPFFRATAIALVVSWLILEAAAEPGLFRGRIARLLYAGRSDSKRTMGKEMIGDRSGRRLVAWAAASLAALVLAAAMLVTIAPASLRERLLSPRNAYGRLATWTVAMKMVYDHPLLGVGPGNYEEYFHRVYRVRNLPIELALNTHAAGQPHSNLVWIAAELGITGLIIYILANYCLLKIGYSGLRRATGPRARLAAACFIALFSVYWIPGLELTSGGYSDLNLYFFFLLGVLSGFFLPGERANRNVAPITA